MFCNDGTHLCFVDGALLLHTIPLLFFADVACCQAFPIDTATMDGMTFVDCVIDNLRLIQQLRLATLNL